MPAPNLRQVRTFKDLIRYLEDELHWPLDGYEMEDLTFDYEPADLGLKDEDAAKVKTIRQLRPLTSSQPWGIFFIEFDKKKLPVVLLRRILSHLVVKKRASANKADRAAWNAEDLLFVSAFGPEDADGREIGFAHFHQESGDLPSLRVLGWDGADTAMKLNTVAATLRERLSWPEKGEKLDAWQQRWAGAFKHRIGHVIRTSDMLAEAMAALAKRIRDAATTIMQHETVSGPLRKLHRAFQTNLIHDLTEEGFADTYAQTITYGLFTAALSKTDMSGGRHGTALIASNIIDMVPVTNPFLKEMLSTFLNIGGRKGGIDFDELGIQDVVELLRGGETDLPAIRDDFGNRTRGEDPVIHFYERFLSAYNKQLKIQRGVFYTPQPVVSYIVRSVHELLQAEFGLTDGLADTATWGEMLKKHPGLKLPPLTDEPGEKRTISPDEPFVQILDPATGTATFLVEVIEVIHRTLAAKWKQQRLNDSQQRTAWNNYVPQHLLPRLHAFELMMAPYAIAHMKIGLKLAETGYSFGTEERARIYLTNALEPWVKNPKFPEFEALAHEASAVNEIKRHKRFTVVIGNPPYSSGSLNKNSWILNLLEDYKQGLGERKIYLDDDFIKFFRLAHHLLVMSCGPTIMGMITNNTHLDGITQRKMRQQLARDFAVIKITNLHGNLREGETCPDGSADENVFDILQGVSITVAASSMRESKALHCVYYRDIWGSRENKYRALLTTKDEPWISITPEPPSYRFLPSFHELESEYALGIPIPELLVAGVTGVQTKRDQLVFAETPAELRKRFQHFRDGSITPSEIRARFGVKDIPEWKLTKALTELKNDRSWEKCLTECLYRPFDVRPIFYSGDFIARDRREVMRHMLAPNLALVITRQSNPTEPWTEFLVTDTLVEKRALASYSGEARAYPLFLSNEDQLDSKPVANVSSVAVSLFRSRLGWKVDADEDARRMFHYIYAVGHSPSFRLRYDTLIKRDYLRIPICSNPELADALARMGRALSALHLLESPKLAQSITKFVGTSKDVTKVGYSDNTVWINAGGTKGNATAGTSGFCGVPATVWNFHIGGYQVCEKWLKDRQGRALTKDDIAHYNKIVVALSETIRLMQEIDEVIEQHGGWPAAFQSTLA